MSPFVPPPSREAPYIALPRTRFSLRFKLRVCLWVYLQWQLPGVICGMFIAVYLGAEHYAYFKYPMIQHIIFLHALVPVGVLGLFGVIAAVWRFILIQTDEVS